MNRLLIVVVVFLFLFGVTKVSAQYPPFSGAPANPMERRPRIVEIPREAKVLRYEPFGKLYFGREEVWPDDIVTPSWKSSDGRIVSVSMMIDPEQTHGIHFIMFITKKYTVGFGITSRPVEYLKSNNNKVLNMVDNIDKPYVLRKDKDGYTMMKNSDKAERVFNLFSKWWYEFQLPYMKNSRTANNTFDNEELFSVLDSEYPREWWWVTGNENQKMLAE